VGHTEKSGLAVKSHMIYTSWCKDMYQSWMYHQPVALLSFVDLYLLHQIQIPAVHPLLMRLTHSRTNHHQMQSQSKWRRYKIINYLARTSPISSETCVFLWPEELHWLMLLQNQDTSMGSKEIKCSVLDSVNLLHKYSKLYNTLQHTSRWCHPSLNLKSFGSLNN
jgi:hypothetical protein